MSHCAAVNSGPRRFVRFRRVGFGLCENWLVRESLLARIRRGNPSRVGWGMEVLKRSCRDENLDTAACFLLSAFNELFLLSTAPLKRAATRRPFSIPGEEDRTAKYAEPEGAILDSVGAALNVRGYVVRGRVNC